ncbi:MAG: (Fe-S)-binding protein [Promethearchaeota archaeon]
MERLQELKKDIYKCIHCKACMFAYSGDPMRKGIGKYQGKNEPVLYEGMVQACPAGIEFGWEAYWNAGKIWITRAVLEGDLELTEEVRDVALRCITCGMCATQCDNKVRTVDIIEALRAALVEAGVPLIGVHATVSKYAEELNNPYGGKADERMKWAKDAGLDKWLNRKDAKIAYFIGCTASYRQTNIAVATCNLLEKLGFDFTVIEDEVCCGSPFFRIGKMDTARMLMKKNLELFKDFDLVLFSCAGCYRTFALDYPKWTKEKNPFKTQHAMEIIAQRLKDGEITLKGHPDLKDKVVTYHDPCHTGRHFGLEFERELIEQSKNLMFDMRKLGAKLEAWFDIPRSILRAIPDIVFREMYRIKMDSMCCGAGGGVRAGFVDFSLRTSSRRLDEANAIAADIITTECPFCWRNLSDANEQFEHGLEVYGILEMIDKFGLMEVKK